MVFRLPFLFFLMSQNSGDGNNINKWQQEPHFIQNQKTTLQALILQTYGSAPLTRRRRDLRKRVLNCLHINRVTNYREKCLGIVTIKVLAPTFFRYNLKEIISNFSNNLKFPKMKLNRIHLSASASSIIKCLENFEKMTYFCKSFCLFFWKSWHIHFNPSQNVSPILLLNGLVMVTNEGSIACKCFKTGNIRGCLL